MVKTLHTSNTGGGGGEGSIPSRQGGNRTATHEKIGWTLSESASVSPGESPASGSESLIFCSLIIWRILFLILK